MSISIRAATFNLENLDDKPNKEPSLDTRIAVIRPQLVRLRADILCLQEVNGQEAPGRPRRLLALEKLLSGTEYATYHVASTKTADGSQVYDERNLVTLSRFPIAEHHQYKHKFTSKPAYKMVTAEPPEDEAKDVSWERPIFFTKIMLPGDSPLYVINLHLKSKLPSSVPGQKLDRYTWQSVPGWAEGFFVAAMQRVGQALETRVLVDRLFDQDAEARIIVCGDFNAGLDETAVQAICGDVEDTGNSNLVTRVLVPCERTIPEPSRYSLLYRGKGKMLDHVIVSRSLLPSYRGAEIHNELLHDESVGFATDKKFPESDHAPVIASFVLPDA